MESELGRIEAPVKEVLFAYYKKLIARYCCNFNIYLYYVSRTSPFYSERCTVGWPIYHLSVNPISILEGLIVLLDVYKEQCSYQEESALGLH